LTETVIKLGAKIYPESETTRNLFYSLAVQGKLSIDMTRLLINYNVSIGLMFLSK
jgi:hypothetical protein